MTQVNQSELAEIISTCVGARVPTLTIGAPGIGKTAIHAQVAEKLGYDFKEFYPALHEPTDVAGMPIPVGGKLVRMLDDYLSDLFTTKVPTLFLIDEIGQASPAMQAACAPLLHARRVGKHVLPQCVSISMATNRRTDRAAAGLILNHITSRCGWVGELACSFQHWEKWAIENRIATEIISFLRYRSELLHKYDPEKAYLETAPSPDPRKWEKLSRVLEVGIPRGVESSVLAGCIGEGAAAEFQTHLLVVRELPDIDRLLETPDAIEFPKAASARYALSSGLAYRCNEVNAANIFRIAERMHKHKMGEFGMLLVRDAMTVYPRVTLHPAYKEFCKSSLGQAIRHV